MMAKAVYAVYRGEELLFHGTIEDISEETYLSIKTLRTYSSPSYLKKNENTNAIKLIKVDMVP